jgi:hypothetical protein
MAKCSICKTRITKRNDGMFIRQFLTSKEISKLPVEHLCVSCKKELFFANLIEVI